ncbi:MAG: hypothetical protein JWQ40_977 [Segetibacter sp.]|nr:hypothetical protein [Segetibacter sp.]
MKLKVLEITKIETINNIKNLTHLVPNYLITKFKYYFNQR